MSKYLVCDPYDPDREAFVFDSLEDAEIEYHFRRFVKYSPCPELSNYAMPRVTIWEIVGLRKVQNPRHPKDIPADDILPF